MKITDIVNNIDYVSSTLEDCEDNEDLDELDKDPHYERVLPENPDNVGEEGAPVVERPRGLDYVETDLLVFQEEVTFSAESNKRGECEVIQV